MRALITRYSMGQKFRKGNKIITIGGFAIEDKKIKYLFKENSDEISQDDLSKMEMIKPQRHGTPHKQKRILSKR